MGGQVADHGVIKDAEGQVVANVLDVQHAPHGQNLHSVETLSPLKVGESYTLEIDKERRAAVVKIIQQLTYFMLLCIILLGIMRYKLVHLMRLNSYVLTLRTLHK